jgi:hypothetical protein
MSATGACCSCIDSVAFAVFLTGVGLLIVGGVKYDVTYLTTGAICTALGGLVSLVTSCFACCFCCVR